MSVMAKALFLDRDGVINHEVGYLYRSEDVRWVDGIFSLCRSAVQSGYKLVVVTNQSGIARGYYSEADFGVLMDWMRAEFAAQGVRTILITGSASTSASTKIGSRGRGCCCARHAI
jgi:HAD superfamily hydrolase (TIGR01662 family)